MNDDSVQVDKQLRTLKIIAVAMLVGAPPVYLIIAQNIGQKVELAAGSEVMIYLLLFMAIASPAAVPIIARHHIRNYRSSQNSNMTPMNLFFTLSIIGMAFAEASYIYGLVSFLMTGELVNMLYFYPIGIIWSFVHWPKLEKYERLLEKLGRP